MPAGTLSLVTQRSYTPEEARDVINFLLLKLGFTLLRDGEVLSLTPVAKIDPSRVPRVRPEELSGHQPHEFVKTSFKLVRLLASKAANEVKPMLSPNGRLTPLTETNRLEAMDAVANLQQIHEVLREEQSGGETRSVRDFVIQNTGAKEILEHLERLLRVESRSLVFSPAGSSLQEGTGTASDAVQQQASGDRPSEPQVRASVEPDGNALVTPQARRAAGVRMTVNPRRNSVVVHGTPDTLALISDAVQVLDVPNGDGRSLLDNVRRTRIYRLHRLSAETLAKTLLDSGDLEPSAQLRTVDEGRALIVSAPLADHLFISALVEQLDGTGRRFEVVRLRDLSADKVAGTISIMMGAERETPRSLAADGTVVYPNPDASPQTYGMPRPQPADRFRVEADVANNRLLFLASEFEMREVQTLLAKLGETRDESDSDKIRVVPIPSVWNQEALDMLRKHWRALAPNPLELPTDPAKPDSEAPQAERTQVEAAASSRSSAMACAAFVPPQDSPSDSAAITDSPPAVKVTIAPRGQWIISSQDGKALDRLEALLSRYRQPPLDYQVFKLRYASTSWFAGMLRQFVDEEPAKPTQVPVATVPISTDLPQLPMAPPEPSTRLSKRPALKIIAADAGNSVLVRGADPDLLQTISQLVEYYDQPPQPGSQLVRVTDVFPLKHSRADDIAATIREVYKDLLEGPNELSKDSRQSQLISLERRPVLATFGKRGEDSNGTVATFRGRLSVGVDEISNALVISADGEHLLRSVGKMIESLDRSARHKDEVHVVRLPAGVSLEQVRQSLDGVLRQKSGSRAQPAATNLEGELGQGARKPGGIRQVTGGNPPLVPPD